jgi:hypothetical protein
MSLHSVCSFTSLSAGNSNRLASLKIILATLALLSHITITSFVTITSAIELQSVLKNTDNRRFHRKTQRLQVRITYYIYT